MTPTRYTRQHPRAACHVLYKRVSRCRNRSARLHVDQPGPAGQQQTARCESCQSQFCDRPKAVYRALISRATVLSSQQFVPAVLSHSRPVAPLDMCVVVIGIRLRPGQKPRPRRLARRKAPKLVEEIPAIVAVRHSESHGQIASRLRICASTAGLIPVFSKARGPAWTASPPTLWNQSGTGVRGRQEREEISAVLVERTAESVVGMDAGLSDLPPQRRAPAGRGAKTGGGQLKPRGRRARRWRSRLASGGKAVENGCRNCAAKLNPMLSMHRHLSRQPHPPG
jgi:hypothetical protein